MNLLSRGQGNHPYADMVQFKGDSLPDAAINALTTEAPFEKKGILRCPFDYPGNWIAAYHEKTSKPEEAKRWILIMDNGSTYKVGAIAIVWYNTANEEHGNVGSKCYWTTNSLISSVNQLLRKGELNRCIHYQT